MIKNGEVNIVRKGGYSFSCECNSEGCRLMAEAEARAQREGAIKEPALFRFFRYTGHTYPSGKPVAAFVRAWFAKDGKVEAWDDVRIPAEVW